MANEELIEELDEVEETDDEETEEKPKTYRPSDLAEALDLDGKTIRAYLRKEFTRSPAEKNTSWVLDQETYDAVIEHFTSDEDEDEELEELEELEV